MTRKDGFTLEQEEEPYINTALKHTCTPVHTTWGTVSDCRLPSDVGLLRFEG